MKKDLSFLLVLFASFVISKASAQNNSPYWSLNGNSNASATTSKLGTTNAIPLRLFTNNIERGRIDISGRLGIGTGTSTLSSRFVVNSSSGTSPFRAQINNVVKLIVSGNGGLSVGSASAGPTNGLYVSGNVGLGTTNPSQKLHVVGHGLFTTGVTVTNGGISSSNTSTNGNGVFAKGYYGVYATGSNTGVYGTSSGNGFGVTGNAYVGVYATSTGSGGDALKSYAYGSSGYGVNAYSALSFGIYASTGTSSSYAGYFAGNVYSSGNYLGSDRNLKQNISDMSSGMDLINKLHPKAYEYRQDGYFKLMNLPSGKHFGLIAQDVEEVFPNLVKETEFKPTTDLAGEQNKEKLAVINFKAINYTELIPIMVKAIQELSEENKDLKQELMEIKATLSRLTGEQKTTINLNNAGLGLVSPNPVKGVAIFQYSFPQTVHTAELLITDNLGRMVRTIKLNSSGIVKMDASTLSSGVYNYSLIIDKKIIDTRKMTVQ